METLEVHSKDYLVKWVTAPDNCVIDWQARPLKKSINLAIYIRRGGDDSPTSASTMDPATPGTGADDETDTATDTTALRKRSESMASVNQIADSNMFKTKSRSSTLSSLVSSSNLVLVKDYHKLISNELVHGKFDVEKGGTYAFVFDNSFSKTISKKVLFSSKTLPRENVPGSHSGANGTSGNDTGSEPKGDAVVGNVMRPKNGQFLQSILLKKRRKKLQGFVKRLFVLNFKYGTLTYSQINEATIRGQMPIRDSIVSANAAKRELIVDSGVEVWNLRALNDEDFKVWVDAFNTVKSETGNQVQGSGDGDTASNAHAMSELRLVHKLLESMRERTTDPVFAEEIARVYEKVDDLLAHLSELNTGDVGSIYSHGFVDAQDDVDVPSSVVLLQEETVPSTAPWSQRTGSISKESLYDVAEEEEVVEDDDDDDSLSSVEDTTQLKDVIEEEEEEEDGDDLYPLPIDPIERDTSINRCDHTPPSIISFVRKNVGKDMSTIAMPVDVNEPLTILQKYAEMFEYGNLINNALLVPNDNGEKVLRVAAFAVSCLSSMRARERNIRKPFNPLLGETFELVREDMGFRLIAEKVCHRPPVFAVHAEAKDWTFSFSPAPAQKFWGKSFVVSTKGTSKLTFKKTGETFQWSQPESLIKNLFAGEKYSEPSSSITIKSSYGQRAVVEFAKGGMFSGRSEAVDIKAYDSSKKPLAYAVYGTWTESLTLKTNSTEKLIWECGALLPPKHYGFTEFAATLSKITAIEKDKMAPTDSRLRPDMKVYEQGNIPEAEELKNQLEERQRERRKELEESGKEHVPKFFKHTGGTSPDSGEWVYITGEKSYWNRRKKQDWDDLVRLW